MWRHVLRTWDTDTGNDLHQHYGIDLLDGAVLRRPWWWLRSRILGLLDIHDARLSRWAVEASK